MRNHIIDFPVSRSKAFAEGIEDAADRRRVPVVRPGAPEPVIATDTLMPTPSLSGVKQELIRGRA